MKSLILTTLRLSLTTLGRLSPRWGGRAGFRLFCTPRSRRPVPEAVVSVMERAERFTLEVDGKSLPAYRWRPAEGPEDAPLAVLVHGWESRAGRLAIWVDPLLQAGFQVAAFDAPAHGEAPGKRTNPGDFALAIRSLDERLGPVHTLLGHSVGALASVLAVAGSPPVPGKNLVAERMVLVAGAESGVAATAYFCEVLGLSPAFHQTMLDAAAEILGHPLASYDSHRIFPSVPIPTPLAS